MKRKLILHATNEHPAIYREGHRLVAGKDTNEVHSKEKGPMKNEYNMSQHHPSCKGSDLELIWLCHQCGGHKSASHDSLESWRNVGELLETCKELREVTAACFRVINEHGPSAVDELETELKRCAIKDAFGLRAQKAIAKAELELGLGGTAKFD